MRALARSFTDPRGAKAGLLLLLLAAGCKSSSPVPLVDKFGIEAEGVDWPSADARRRFEEKLFGPNGFRPSTENNRSSGDKVWNLALSIQVPQLGEGANPKEAVAIARLQVTGADDFQQEVVTTGTETVMGPSLDEWREATRGAAAAAMTKAVAGARALVTSVGKTDAELISQLKSKDAQQKEWAAAVLADRKNPAALDTLSELLGTDDLMRARWAMRFLIHLGDPRAATALIEASRHKDDTFQREIVFALGELGGEEAEAYLFTVAEGHDLPLMRQSAERALSELRARKSKDGGVRP